MPLTNRVTPFGDIVATPERGTLMGNRGGRLHDPATRMLVRRHASRQWICCRLDFKDRRRTVMGEGYTELFFLDEVTALAAGHRPCFECRRAAALAFFEAHRAASGGATRASAPALDRLLHAERLARPRPVVRLAGLPDGAMVARDGDAWAVRGGRLLHWTAAGYDRAMPIDENLAATLLTPPLIVSIVAAGYAPGWHGSAGRLSEREDDA